MKITIDLSDAEIEGIRAYIQETDGENPDRRRIIEEVQGIVSGYLHSPQNAIADYVNQFENNQ